MRKVYEVEISNKIESIEDIDEAEFSVIDLLKTAGIPYQTEILSRINYERFNEWDGRYDTYYVISIPEKYIEKLRNEFPEELFNITPKFSEFSEEEQKRINDIESELCNQDDFADANFEEALKGCTEAAEENKSINKSLRKNNRNINVWFNSWSGTYYASICNFRCNSNFFFADTLRGCRNFRKKKIQEYSRK